LDGTALRPLTGTPNTSVPPTGTLDIIPTHHIHQSAPGGFPSKIINDDKLIQGLTQQPQQSSFQDASAFSNIQDDRTKQGDDLDYSGLNYHEESSDGNIIMFDWTIKSLKATRERQEKEKVQRENLLQQKRRAELAELAKKRVLYINSFYFFIIFILWF